MEHLKTLCEDLNLPSELETSENGSFLFQLNDLLQISIRSLDPGALLTSPISSCPEIKREELFIHLMKANLFGQGTLGATLGLDPKQNLLTLSLKIPYDLNYRLFRESLEDFANVVDYWREEIDTHVKQAQEGLY